MAPDPIHPLPRHAIAVVGMVGRFPGAADVETLWANVLAGREGLTFFRDDELDAAIPTAVRKDPAYVRARGVMAECDRFDASFFGMQPLEAQLMDPQHRVMLELAWSALENSGHRPSDFPGRIGVYVGANWNRYKTHCVDTRPEITANFGELNTSLANEQDFLATRISYRLDLKGPSCTVSTACSTSLVAIAQAARSLAEGDCDLALAGGVSITVPVAAGYQYESGGMLSKDGHCRPFDAEGTGTTFNDGAGIVVLRRLADAVAAGDQIYAVIRGFAVNNDGADKVSFTAPSIAGQAAVVRAALAHAAVPAETIGYVEAHGTATPMGDPIEFAALVRAFGDQNPPDGSARAGAASRACAIGSVKGSVGHLVHAAGVTGFITAVLAVQKGVIPPTLFFRTPNPRLQLERSRFFVPVTPRQWQEVGQPRRAGVSSFGVGGTNAHVILEQAPAAVAAPDAGGTQIVCVSARSEAALQRQVEALGRFLAAPTAGTTLAGLAFTLQTGREPMRYRLAVAVDSLADAAVALTERRRVREGEAVRARSVAFLFPGHGVQRAGMGSRLCEQLPVFRRIVDDGIAKVLALGGPDLAPTLRGPAGGAGEGDLRATLPALFVFEHALAEALVGLGVVPAVLLGCSLGEFAAAVSAGVLSFENALRVVVANAEACARAPSGRMLVVYGTAAEVREVLPPGVVIAAVHATDTLVVSGSLAAVELARLALESRGIRTTALPGERAFHSPAMDPTVGVLQELLRGIPLSPPNRQVFSAATGRELTDAEAVSPEYWAQVLRRPIQFAAALDSVGDGGDLVLVEVGPGSSLTALALQHPGARNGVPMAALPGSGLEDGAARALHAVAAHCWAHGAEVSLGGQWQTKHPPRLPLPTYRFERTRHWLEPLARNPGAAGAVAAAGGSSAAAAAAPAVGSKEAAAARIAKVLTGACGLDVAADSASHWSELGFDSLVVTQVAIGIRREFAVEVGFRDLMEQHTSPQLLLQWLLARSPAPAGSAPSQEVAGTAAVQPTATAPATPPGSSEAAPKKPSPGVRIERTVSAAHQTTPAQRAYLDQFFAAYAHRTAKSKAFAQQHRRHLADPRTVSGFHPLWKEIVYPIVTERSSGSRLWDLDGHEYIDFLNGFGCIFFGHSPAFVTDAVREQLAKGIEVGPQSAMAGEVAELFCQLTGNDRVAFSNTGSEAVAGALRIARTVTGRDKIVIFEGAYHGIFDEVVVRAGPQGLALAGSPGIPRSHVGDVVVLPYGTDDSLREIARLGRDLAAVLVEPVQSRRPELQPVDFLRRLRELTTASGTALILDEVVTGFRTHPGGIQALFGVKADMAIYGKVVAGGHPMGLIGGRAQFLDALDGGQWQFGDAGVPEVGVTFFAGTFVRHPVALAATRAVLRRLIEAGPSLQDDLGRRASAMVGEIKAFLAQVGARVKIESFQSMMYVSAPPSEHWSSLLFAQLRYHGIHIWEHFPCFLTTSHSDADLATFKTTFCKVVAELVAQGFLHGNTEESKAVEPARNKPQEPPVAGAKMGRRPDGSLAWFVPDPDRPGKYRELVGNQRGSASR